MKWIDNINKWSFAITLILYITIYWGLIAQIILGGIQLLLSIVLIYNWKNYTKRFKSLLISYWTIVLIYGCISYLIHLTNSFDSFFIITIIVIPISLASYFVYITHILTHQKEHHLILSK